ncbi:MAG: Aspartate carbamoyltransferase catalytic chain PyrB [Candidatus Methanohalarchaeum thermophilum]|uniref:Aspartate carbamoyltransferase n=1 Tax=Methanohalarchaeum thermophilum TaxID=1903181 RepID=A0A1Q6DTX8_METT1|nr:MAG: Aspartate carbamoyltransferase catalytic chain PyrB [Candidatus Methanohalarchaeum thermophilum]
MKLKDKDIVSVEDLSKGDISKILETTKKIDEGDLKADMSGKVLANVFFEPSTRTRLSFETAMKRLGGDVISLNSTQASSISKGESLADTVRVLEGYSDVIVLRHPKEGAPKMASQFVEKPVINAGDGSNEHPTQTLTDLYTIWSEKGSIDGLKIAILGDLKYGRTVHSLVQPLVEYDIQLYLVSPSQLSIRRSILEDLGKKSGEVIQKASIEEIIDKLDVLYVTRIQEERFADKEEYEKVSGSYEINKELLDQADDDLIVMHPLPRIDEISPEVDGLKQSKYFDQSKNGVKIRMALLELILGDNDGKRT